MNYVIGVLLISTAFTSCSKDNHLNLPDPVNEYSHGGNSNVSTGITGKYLHLYRSDGQKLIVYHLNSSAASIENQTFISYKPDFAPTYEFGKLDSNNAEYSLTWTPLSYYNGVTMEIGTQWIEIKMSFNQSDKSRGTFVGITGAQDLSGKRTEKNCSGKFYLGGETDSNGESVKDESYGQVKVIEISSVDNITSNSATIHGKIEIDGKYDEKGVVCVDNSLAGYLLSLPDSPTQFKKTFANESRIFTQSEFSIVESALKSKQYHCVVAYAILGDILVKSETKSFTTK